MNDMQMGAMDYAGMGVGLALFICFVVVVVKMFQNGATGLAIGSLVGFCFCGIGYFVALIGGWVNAGSWRIKPLMAIYTALMLAYFVIFGLNIGTFQARMKDAFEKAQQQQQQRPNDMAPAQRPNDIVPAPK